MVVAEHAARHAASDDRKAAVLGFLLNSYRTLPGSISAPELERSLGAARLAGDLRDDPEALAQLRAHLRATGFTAAPGSAELVRMLNEVPPEELQLQRAGAAFRSCVGLSQAQLADAQRLGLSAPIAGVVLASLAQLELVLPDDAVVLGPLEGTFRGVRGGISWLHNDEHRTSAVYVEQALFPLARAAEPDEEPSRGQAEDVFQHYDELKARMKRVFPDLALPHASECEWRGGNDDAESADGHADGGQAPERDLRGFTQRVLAAIGEYHSGRGHPEEEEEELVFDFVNVWFPKAEKQLALLPFERSRGAMFQRDTRPSVEEVEAAGYKDDFQAFGRGTAVMFFGRYVLHQVAEGPEFAKCDQGSMETRYLVLMPRRSAHRFHRRE